MKDQGPYQATIFFGRVLGDSSRATPGISLWCRHIHSTGGALVRVRTDWIGQAEIDGRYLGRETAHWTRHSWVRHYHDTEEYLADNRRGDVVMNDLPPQ